MKGLAAGADDYLTKPFGPGELLARIGVGHRIIDLHHEIEAKNKLVVEMAHTAPQRPAEPPRDRGMGVATAARSGTSRVSNLGRAYGSGLLQGRQ